MQVFNLVQSKVACFMGALTLSQFPQIRQAELCCLG
uniref:Uncharacterized protein n=1 Tax=Anguilla anguilla TaxID=7936 RepID=A0A0E9PRN3_ANGAN